MRWHNMLEQGPEKIREKFLSSKPLYIITGSSSQLQSPENKKSSRLSIRVLWLIQKIRFLFKVSSYQLAGRTEDGPTPTYAERDEGACCIRKSNSTVQEDCKVQRGCYHLKHGEENREYVAMKHH